MSDFRSHQSSDVVEGEARKRAKALRKPMVVGNALTKSIGGRCIRSYRPYKMARQALPRVLPVGNNAVGLRAGEVVALKGTPSIDAAGCRRLD